MRQRDNALSLSEGPFLLTPEESQAALSESCLTLKQDMMSLTLLRNTMDSKVIACHFHNLLGVAITQFYSGNRMHGCGPCSTNDNIPQFENKPF